MNTTFLLLFNTSKGLEEIKKEKKFMFILLINTVISTILIYLTLSNSIEAIVGNLKNQLHVDLNTSTINNIISTMIIIIGALFPFLTIATNSLLFFIAGKFFMADLTYKNLFKIFNYLYPLTIIANTMMI